MLFNFMAAVTIYRDFGAPQNKAFQFPLFPHLFPMKWRDQMPWSLFSECWALSQLFHSPLSPSSRGSLVLCFLPEGWCRLHIWGYWYFYQQSWFQLMLHSAQHLMMYCAYELNKQGDSIHHSHAPLSIWNQSVVPCPVLTVASWSAYRFPKRQVRWSGIPISWRIFQSLWWSTLLKALA